MNITNGHVFTHKMEVDLDMLHTLVLNGVGGELDDIDVVTVDESALPQQSVELLK
jgi:poly-beta-hydroxyalkanoate depolymerase